MRGSATITQLTPMVANGGLAGVLALVLAFVWLALTQAHGLPGRVLGQ